MAKKSNPNTKRKITWRNNHARIQDAYISALTRLRRLPTLDELSNDTNIDRSTIHRHIQEFNFIPEQNNAKILTEQVIAAIFNGSMQGNVGMARLWIQIFNPELLIQRTDTASIDNPNKSSVLIIPHNNRDDVGVSELSEAEWDALETEVRDLEI